MSRAESEAGVQRSIRDAMQARRIPTQRIDAAVDAARASLDDSSRAGRDFTYATRCAIDAAVLAMCGVAA